MTALLLAASCTREIPPPSTAPLAAPAPPPLPPVACAEYPSERQDTVSCRYVSQAQANEVWARSTQLAATSAISLGASHIQWLSAETSLDMVQGSSPVECKSNWGAFKAPGGAFTCEGGHYEMPVGFVTVTHFVLLSEAEAEPRLRDPLIPPERRPIEAHRIVVPAAR